MQKSYRVVWEERKLDVEAKLRQILSEYDETIDVDALSKESSLKDDLDMSSVALLYMAVAIEDEFGIDFSEIDLGKLVTIGDVIDAVEELK